MSRVQFNGWWAALANSSFNQLYESLKVCKQAFQHALHTFTCVSGLKMEVLGSNVSQQDWYIEYNLEGK